MIALFFATLINLVLLFDGNGDGIQEGVGSGVPVVAVKGLDFHYGVTNQNSAVSFDLSPGIWVASAEIKSDNPFYVWVCQEGIIVGDTSKTVIIDCVTKFRFRIPFLER